MLTGNHLIDGCWIESKSKFASSTVSGPQTLFSEGSPQLVDAACLAAEAAFESYSSLKREDRAKFLECIADQIDACGVDLTAIGSAETGLPPQRLEAERGRTTAQLKLFANHIRGKEFLDLRHDNALPSRVPLPRPDIRMMQMAVGPVAVFGASNFPLAFSVAGGDTASALAAGCPVIVKGHSAHPGTGEIVARAVHDAMLACDIPSGVFSFVQGGSREVGQALVTHPVVQAVGFTGSLSGGRALFDLCAARPVPIPFFGELGSVNPVFVLPDAMRSRARRVATAWVASFTQSVGQMCTKPAILVVPDGPEADLLQHQAASDLAEIGPHLMLTDGIARSFHDGVARFAGETEVTARLAKLRTDRGASPALFVVSGRDWLRNKRLSEEVFGPLGLLVRANDDEEMLEIATALHGQLTCTIHFESGDAELVDRLMPILSRKAGRLVANGFPTGVELGDAMVHGGPYPASTNFGATSVGTMSIRRWLRPVAFQNFDLERLHDDLAD